MAVQKLFWSDPYLTELETEITSVSGNAVTLDQTVFFAFSGGQQSDAGTIGGLTVLEARKDGLEIVYLLPENHGLQAGEKVTVCIDWDRRFRLMRLHFAAELVLELVYRHFEHPEKMGANISPDKARVDFRLSGGLTAYLPELRGQLSALIQSDLPIISTYSDPALERRYWRIEGFGQVPCGGTHPRRTGEIGGVKLKRTNPGKGLERIEITLEDS